jgi:hypothetical protein
MQAFADFVLELTYPPNPIRRLDNKLTPFQQAGADFFFNSASAAGPGAGRACGSCHIFDRDANKEFAVKRPGFFGTDGRVSFTDVLVLVKIPHLRNVYQKVGMFGLANIEFAHMGSDQFMGDQIRGFGISHDGGTPTVFDLTSSIGFDVTDVSPGGFPSGEAGNEQRRQVEESLLVADSNMAPIVGQQITLTSRNHKVVGGRINLLIQRAEAKECDLIAKGLVLGRGTGFLYVGNGSFMSDRTGWSAIPDAVVRALTLVPEGELTFTCVPSGSGRRIGIDHDEDGTLDGDEFHSG